jgi:hypothetical protein
VVTTSGPSEGSSGGAGGADAGGDAQQRKTAESLHPFFHRCEYVGELHCEGAKALRVTFDPRCELPREDVALRFYADAGCSVLLASYPVRPPPPSQQQAGQEAPPPPPSRLRGPAAFPPLVVHADRVFYRFRADKRDESDHGWGYRFHAAPLRGLQWLSERQVLSDPSLEWACWLLEFLLLDASRASREIFEAVHHRAIFDALVRYLRTPSAPFKHRAVTLLTQLLAHPQAFTGSQLPDMGHLLAVSQLVLARARREQEAGRVFLSPPLLRLV